VKRHRKTKRSRRAVLVQLLVGAIVCCSGFALTAALTVNPGKAGDGAGVVANSTFSVASIRYQLNASTPTLIDQVVVTFASNPAPADVRASIGGVWSNACSASGLVFTCAFSSLPSVPFNATTALRVAATS
jgi:hypothetical protein